MDVVETQSQPILVIAEGLLMYLSDSDIQTLFNKMRDKFKNITFVFDAYSKMTAKQAKHHPSLKKTGATIGWGVDSPRDIEQFGRGIKHIETLYLTKNHASQHVAIWISGDVLDCG